MNLTARIARWSVDHWKTAVFGWVALVVALVVIAGQVGTKAQSDVDTMTGESQQGQRMLEESGLVPDASEIVLITGSAADAGASAGARDLARSIARTVDALPGVSNVTWDGDGLVARDGDARMITFDMNDGAGARDTVDDRIDAVRDAVIAADERSDGLRVQQFGDATINGDIGEIVGEDLGRAELLTAPITLVILFVTFGALVAAGMPLLIGIVSVIGAIALGGIVSHVLRQTDFAANLVSMMGIALGVDYTLFLLRREREERAKGASRRDAIIRAAATSGTAVVISGITVIVALSGLLLSGSAMFVSMGVATMLVVAMVLLASLFVVPALLSKLGDNVERGRLPRITRARRAQPRRTKAQDSRAWGAVASFAVRRPVTSIICVGSLLVAACIPALGMETGDSTLAAFPQTKPSLRAAAAFEQHFPGGVEPAEIVVRDDRGDLRASQLDAAVAQLERAADRAGVASGAADITTSDDGRTHLVSLPLVGSDSRAASDRAVDRLRAITIDTVEQLPGTTVAVTGGAANSRDFADTLSSHLPLVFLVVLGSAFVLLACAFRSIVVPLVAVVLNLLSVGAAYGFLVWGYQHGNLKGIVPVAGDGVIVSWMPIFLFALLFGLSMDYHVFLLSRIREHVLAGYSTRDAVVMGVRGSASTISSAALIMVGVFSAFALSQMAEMQQMGAGLAVAILIDATVIRGMLLPAVMSLLGRANWYMPSWLGWLPTVAAEGRAGRTPNTQEATAR